MNINLLTHIDNDKDNCKARGRLTGQVLGLVMVQDSRISLSPF